MKSGAIGLLIVGIVVVLYAFCVNTQKLEKAEKQIEFFNKNYLPKSDLEPTFLGLITKQEGDLITITMYRSDYSIPCDSIYLFEEVKHYVIGDRFRLIRIDNADLIYPKP